MKKDLRSMAKKLSQPAAPDETSVDQRQIDSVMEQARRYDGKSENELMDELMKKVGEQKASGSFSPEMLDQFAQRASSMMDDAQKKKLRQIIARIKSN